ERTRFEHPHNLHLRYRLAAKREAGGGDELVKELPETAHPDLVLAAIKNGVEALYQGVENVQVFCFDGIGLVTVHLAQQIDEAVHGRDNIIAVAPGFKKRL